jgi:DNA-binding NarL/FixJ family response regulator
LIGGKNHRQKNRSGRSIGAEGWALDMDVREKKRADATRCSVVAFNLHGQARCLLEGLCANSTPFVFSWAADTLADLMRLAATVAPDLLVLDKAALGDRTPFVLAELHAVAPRARSLLVGEVADRQLTRRLVARGLRGIVPHARLEIELPRALETLMRGEMWFSRQVMAELLSNRVGDLAPRRSDALENVHALTDREFTVMHGILQGSTNKDIARSLRISEQTVKIHVQNIFRKLRVHRRIDLLLLHESARP